MANRDACVAGTAGGAGGASDELASRLQSPSDIDLNPWHPGDVATSPGAVLEGVYPQEVLWTRFAGGDGPPGASRVPASMGSKEEQEAVDHALRSAMKYIFSLPRTLSMGPVDTGSVFAVKGVRADTLGPLGASGAGPLHLMDGTSTFAVNDLSATMGKRGWDMSVLENAAHVGTPGGARASGAVTAATATGTIGGMKGRVATWEEDQRNARTPCVIKASAGVIPVIPQCCSGRACRAVMHGLPIPIMRLLPEEWDALMRDGSVPAIARPCLFCDWHGPLMFKTHHELTHLQDNTRPKVPLHSAGTGAGAGAGAGAGSGSGSGSGSTPKLVSSSSDAAKRAACPVVMTSTRCLVDCPGGYKSHLCESVPSVMGAGFSGTAFVPRMYLNCIKMEHVAETPHSGPFQQFNIEAMRWVGPGTTATATKSPPGALPAFSVLSGTDTFPTYTTVAMSTDAAVPNPAVAAQAAHEAKRAFLEMEHGDTGSRKAARARGRAQSRGDIGNLASVDVQPGAGEETTQHHF